MEFKTKKTGSFNWKTILGIAVLLIVVVTCFLPEKPRTEYGADYSSYVLRQVRATINKRIQGTGYTASGYDIEQVNDTRYYGSFYLYYGGVGHLQHFQVETDGYGNGTGLDTY